MFYQPLQKCGKRCGPGFFSKPWLCYFLILMLAGFVSGCTGGQGQSEQEPVENAVQSAAFATQFAEYEEVPVSCTPAVKSYRVESDLANVENRDMFELSPAAREMLVKNGFVVVPNEFREFFMLYETNRYDPVPSFITTDSMLHNYHLYFNHLLRVLEKEKLAPELKELTGSMLSAAEKQYADLKGTEWENAAKRNMGFFAVAGKLLDPGFPVPQIVKNEVEKELELISKYDGIEVSPLMNMGGSGDVLDVLQEDYSQYIPRGHYDNSSLLRSYFKAMMWYGRLTFRVKSEDETRSAVLITLALDQGDNRQKWDRIYSVTNFFVGKSDDLSYVEYKALLNKIYGSRAGLQEVVSEQDKWAAFREEAGRLKPPVVNSIPVFEEEIQSDREKEVQGFRFMGQRYTLDASIFQRLVYREVEENEKGQRRMLPMALDIPATMGSREARNILQQEGETGYRNYLSNMEKMQQYIAGLERETWTQNLYWGWLYSLQPLIEEKGAGYPFFMRNTAWARKELNTFLGSWTELKHDTILYAKQVYAEMGGGAIGVDDRGYVEPNPVFYARLASLVKMTREGLLSRELLDERDRESLERMEQLALSLKNISEKELSETPLTDEEYDLIRSYGGQLEHFWLEALRDEGVEHRSAIYQNPAALVADVATDPNGRVLEEATGHIFEIYVVVPVDGKLRITRGGVYSHYEFTRPLNQRLTDKEWREMLDANQAPALPRWTEMFVTP